MQIDTEAAIATAENHVGAEVEAEVSCWLVQRLDRVNSSYYMVVVQQSQIAVAAVLVDGQTGGVNSCVHFTLGASPIVLPKDQVPILAGLDPADEVDLVWAICQATRSPFSPLWRVRRGRQVRYLDQHGTVWTDIVLETGHAACACG